MRIIDNSRAHISEFNFAMQWNKIGYAQIHILNHNTILDWTVRFLYYSFFFGNKKIVMIE